jgi:hypothetical protein
VTAQVGDLSIDERLERLVEVFGDLPGIITLDCNLRFPEIFPNGTIARR